MKITKKLTKEEFKILHDSLPEKERKKIIIKINNIPYSINVMDIEINANTKLGNLMLIKTGELLSK